MVDVFISMIYSFEKNQPLVHGRPSFRRLLKQTVEHMLPFIFQNDRLSSGSRDDLKKKLLSPGSRVYKKFGKYF